LKVAAGALGQTGQLFYQSANGVWLTDIVPPEFLSLNPH
jgi:putative RNA 2'-phosphotransferase